MSLRWCVQILEATSAGGLGTKTVTGAPDDKAEILVLGEVDSELDLNHTRHNDRVRRARKTPGFNIDRRVRYQLGVEVEF